MDVKLNTATTQATGVRDKTSNGHVRFERGPESMFRRVLIQDPSGNLLENFENYNDLYCLTELLSDGKQNRVGFSAHHVGGLKVPGNTVPIIVYAAATSNATTVDVCPFAVNATANGTLQFNAEYSALTYPSLGGVIDANYCMGNSTDNRNPTEYNFFLESGLQCTNHHLHPRQQWWEVLHLPTHLFSVWWLC